MSGPTTLDIGWLPERFDEAVGDITLATLPGFDEALRAIKESEGVENLQQEHRTGSYNTAH